MVIPAQRNGAADRYTTPLAQAQIARADAAAELELARQVVRELGRHGIAGELSDQQRVADAEHAYDRATAQVRRLTRAGAA